MVDFINEVEEELRKDKYNQLLRKFGPYIVALIVIIVAATGYMEYNKAKVSKIARAASASYESADKIEKSGDLQGAAAKFIALSKVAPDGYAGLSLSRAAGIEVRLGDMTSAVNLFDQAADKFHKPIHKDLASLKAAYILLDEGRYDDVQARAGMLTNDGAPYADFAKELMAHAALLSGDTKSAEASFSYLSNAPGVLPGVKARAGQALALIKAERPVAVHKLEAPQLEAPMPEMPKDTNTTPNQDGQE